jgi:hypothetical protein
VVRLPDSPPVDVANCLAIDLAPQLTEG